MSNIINELYDAYTFITTNQGIIGKLIPAFYLICGSLFGAHIIDTVVWTIISIREENEEKYGK